MDEKLPLVSVITPTYNHASYLDETIQSVLGQDYPNTEYIVLDDGSTDNTREVLEKYVGRIIWETHPNMGEAHTVNKGCGMVHGEVVVVVNSDDPLLPGALREGMAFMECHPDILVAYPDWDSIGPDSELLHHVQVHDYNGYLDFIKVWGCIIGPGAFIRRKCFELTGGRDPRFRYAGDWEYWLRLGLHGQFARIPKTLATHRVHPGSMQVSHGRLAIANAHISLAKEYFSRPGLPPAVRRLRRQAFARAYVRACEWQGLGSLHYVNWLAAAIFHYPPILPEIWLRFRLWPAMSMFHALPSPAQSALAGYCRRARNYLLQVRR
jgi:glycosyltransferase involved in cell wall biosynthesis